MSPYEDYPIDIEDEDEDEELDKLLAEVNDLDAAIAALDDQLEARADDEARPGVADDDPIALLGDDTLEDASWQLCLGTSASRWPPKPSGPANMRSTAGVRSVSADSYSPMGATGQERP
jgi:hypothetical protein